MYRLKIVRAYSAKKSVVQIQSIFGGPFQVETDSQQSTSWTNSWRREVYTVQDNIKGRSGRPWSVRRENHIVIVRHI